MAIATVTVKALVQSTANIDNFKINKGTWIQDIEDFGMLLDKKFRENISTTIYAETNDKENNE